MTKILSIFSLLITCICYGQYPFDDFPRPNFTEYDDWKIVDDSLNKKVHQTVTISKFYENEDLTIQFTVEHSDPKWKNIVRIYKGKKTIQSFRNDKVDYWPNYISKHPIKIADLNGDSLLDIKVTYDYNSNGLALSYRPIYFIQSKDGHFIKYSFDCKFEDRIDLERDFNKDGIFEIQHVSLISKNDHSYWCFRVLEFENNGLTEVSSIKDYPLFVQFLNKRNYKKADVDMDLSKNPWNSELIIDFGTVIK